MGWGLLPGAACMHGRQPAALHDERKRRWPDDGWFWFVLKYSKVEGVRFRAGAAETMFVWCQNWVYSAPMELLGSSSDSAHLAFRRPFWPNGDARRSEVLLRNRRGTVYPTQRAADDGSTGQRFVAASSTNLSVHRKDRPASAHGPDRAGQAASG